MEANGTYTFRMLFEPAEEGGYVVTCPALPGLVTEGDTRKKRDEWRKMLCAFTLRAFEKMGCRFPPSRTSTPTDQQQVHCYRTASGSERIIDSTGECDGLISVAR
jgi:antitoxin HicB